MKVIRLFSIILFLITCLLTSCKNKSTETVNELTNIAETGKAIQEGKYALKSGIVEYKTTMMGMNAKQVITFDDYGNKEITEVIMDKKGTKIHTVTLNKDSFIYNYDAIKKTGTKTAMSTIKTPDINFEKMTKKMMQEMNIKKEGSEKFLGKNCEIVSIDNPKMQMKGNYLIYKGIPMKVNAEIGKMKMNLLAEKFIENPSIPAEKFIIPADVKIKE